MALGSTFNLGEIYRNAEAVRGAKLQNDYLAQQQQTQNVLLDTARQAVDPQTGEYNVAQHVKALNALGYPQVGQEIATKFADRASKVIDYANRAWPYLNADTYPKFRDGLQQLGMDVGMLPEQYDPQLLAKGKMMLEGQYGDIQRLGQGTGGTEIWGQPSLIPGGEVKNLQILKPPKPDKPGRPMAVENNDGTVTYVDPTQALGKHAPKPASAQEKPFKFTASDANAIYHQSVGLFGGTWDPITGNVAGMDKDSATRAQSIAARASQIYRESAGAIDHASAVEQAVSDVNSSKPGGGSQRTIERPQTAGGTARIRTAADYAAVPSGAQYIDPNGNTRTKR
jgi:hypothetical protein